MRTSIPSGASRQPPAPLGSAPAALLNPAGTENIRSDKGGGSSGVHTAPADRNKGTPTAASRRARAASQSAAAAAKPPRHSTRRR
eukprot:5810429-Prymnesium_polylepis.1